ncbi:glycosyltransferase [Sungkyunkwania multivorans]|uniref:Glycosyltransferase n=1 Tax=Sungkyunkwania multivorans TaxID=1173618 RepID=A0ABW3CY65_9FLAO
MLNVLLYTFLLCVGIQLIYYLFIFARFSFSKDQAPKNDSDLPISVMICAKNESENLREFIPLILQQAYSNFELLLVNDHSSDDSLSVMEDFQTKFPEKVKVVNVEEGPTFRGNKKYALTLGIRTAQHSYLVFTDADCRPISQNWLSCMASGFSESKDIVLGYGAYEKIKGSFLNKLIRYETVLSAIQYFSYAKIGLPYMGVGRNLAYKKELFYHANGFEEHMEIMSGDDDLFINQVASKQNVALQYQHNSFTVSLAKKSWRAWFRQKRRHISTAYHYRLEHRILLALFFLSTLLFWGLGIALVMISKLWPWVAMAFLLRMIIQYLVIGYGAKKLKETDIWWLVPVLEVTLIIFHFTIFIVNRISTPTHWK